MPQSSSDTLSVTWTAVTAGGSQSASDTMSVTWNAPVAGGAQSATDLVTVTWTGAAWNAYRWDTTTRALIPVALGRWVAGAFVWLTDPVAARSHLPSPNTLPSTTLTPGA